MSAQDEDRLAGQGLVEVNNARHIEPNTSGGPKWYGGSQRGSVVARVSRIVAVVAVRHPRTRRPTTRCTAGEPSDGVSGLGDTRNQEVARRTTSATANATTPHVIAFSASSSGANSTRLVNDDVRPSPSVTVPSTESIRRRRLRAGVLNDRCAADRKYAAAAASSATGRTVSACA